MKIAVVGSLNMDMMLTAEKIPLKGETIRGNDIVYNAGGKGNNQAVAMAKLGAEVEMFGCVGNDDHGTHLINNLKSYGVKTDHIKRLEDVPTGLAVITVGEQDNTIIIIGGANEKVDVSYIDEIEEELLTYDMVVLQHEIPLETVYHVINLCHDHNIKVVLNPAPAEKVPLDIIEKLSYLTPNEHEVKLIFGDDQDMNDLLKKYPEKLIVTLGSKGVATCLKSGEVIIIPANKVEVVDTTGAGDTLNGAFCVQIAKGEDIKTALTYANAAAGLSIGKFGAQTGMPTFDEVSKLMV